MNSIGTRLKQWRKSNHLPMTEVCKKANIAQSALSEYENNKSIPGGKILLQLYRSFDIDIQYILTGTESTHLTENEKELLEIFAKLPEREQIKFIGRMEEALIRDKEHHPNNMIIGKKDWNSLQNEQNLEKTHDYINTK